MQGMASLSIAIIVAVIGFLGLGYGVFELMTHSGADAGIKTLGAFVVYFIACLALTRLAY